MNIITAIGTISLALLTAVYVVLTATIAKKSGESASSANLAAAAAQKAAESASRSALAAEAQLQFKFLADVSRNRDGTIWLNLGCPTANVYIHYVEAELSTVIEKTPLRSTADPRSRMKRPSGHPNDPPQFLHAGESESYEFVNCSTRLTDYGLFGFVYIAYSLSLDSDVRTYRASFESELGLIDFCLATIRRPNDSSPSPPPPSPSPGA